MRRIAILIVVVLVLACASAQATIFNFAATLDGAQETPPTISPGTGHGTFVYDSVANSLQIDVTFSGLTAPATAGHIHVAPPGVPGPIVFPFVNVPNATSGTIVNTWLNLSAANINDLFAGDLYANIHTPNFPGGEIRGQIELVPELPASALAFVPGMIALIRFRKK